MQNHSKYFATVLAEEALAEEVASKA